VLRVRICERIWEINARFLCNAKSVPRGTSRAFELSCHVFHVEHIDIWTESQVWSLQNSRSVPRGTLGSTFSHNEIIRQMYHLYLNAMDAIGCFDHFLLVAATYIPLYSLYPISNTLEYDFGTFIWVCHFSVVLLCSWGIWAVVISRARVPFGASKVWA